MTNEKSEFAQQWGTRPQAEAGQLATNSFVKRLGLLMVSSVFLTLVTNIILWIFKWNINKHQSQVTGKHHKASYDWYVVEVWVKYSVNNLVPKVGFGWGGLVIRI